MGNGISEYGEISFYNTLSPKPSNIMLALGGVKKDFAKTGTTLSAKAGGFLNLRNADVTPLVEFRTDQHVTNIGKVKLGAQLRTRTELENGDTKVRFAATQKTPITKGVTWYATEYGVTRNFKGNITYGAFSGLIFDNKTLFNKDAHIKSEYIEGEYTSSKDIMFNFGFFF